jgi:predicted ester cyclase
MGIGPTGRHVEVTGIEINRLDRGKIADSWAISDADGLRRQLEE